MKNIIFFFIVLFCVTSCSIERLYKKSIKDAEKVKESEISHNLISINRSNKTLIWKKINGEDYILVTSWQPEAKYYKNKNAGFYNTSKYDVWVTVVPNIKDFCKKELFSTEEKMNLRLKQSLGLPPTKAYQYFIEFWVKPEDLFRPCHDEDINDSFCNLSFPEFVEKEHKEWIVRKQNESYSKEEWDRNYPWTQLGYTYDWNRGNKNNIGFSEFVISNNSNVVVKGIYTTDEYCLIEKE